MSEYITILEHKLSLIEESYRSGGAFNGNEQRFAAFISLCDTDERAFVLRSSADSPEGAFRSACNKARDFVRKYDFAPVWVKTDITAVFEKIPFAELQKRIAASLNEFFRRGIAFDDNLDTALIEAEINGNRVISYKKHMLELRVLNDYLSSCELATLSQFPEYVTLFDCEGRFCGDDGKVYKLGSFGRRIGGEFTDKTALEVIAASSEYLSMQVGMDGRFDYGLYPINHREIRRYNILRHAASIWSLLCAYRLTHDKFTLNQIIKAVGFTVANTYRIRREQDGRENITYLADKTVSEVKIGGNATAIIMLTEYMDVVKTDKYVTLCRELGSGILELFDENDGSFYHVLSFPDLKRKEKFRTVYYDGETIFALCRLYGLTGEKKWLDAAAKASDRLIAEKYERYRDHWASYAINELTKYLPEDKYLSFGLKNADVNLDRIYNTETTYSTYLELLCAAFELYSRIVDKGLQCSYLKEFNLRKFIETIYHRADYMLNGYGYPELVMYLKCPSAIVGSFFVRHDGFRIRIDDIQHNCGAYCLFYKNYDKLSALKKQLETEVDTDGT